MSYYTYWHGAWGAEAVHIYIYIYTEREACDAFADVGTVLRCSKAVAEEVKIRNTPQLCNSNSGLHQTCPNFGIVCPRSLRTAKKYEKRTTPEGGDDLQGGKKAKKAKK